MFKHLNRRISTPIAITIIVILAVILTGGVFVYQYLMPTPRIQSLAINPTKNAPNFSFEMSDEGKGGINLIIKNKTAGNIVQTISIPDIDLSFFKNFTVADVVNNNNDINFDGYKDLQVLVDIPGSNPGKFDFYTYNPSTERFDKDPTLRFLSGPNFDPATKTITTHQSGGCAGAYNTRDTYSFINGKYILTQTKQSNCCAVDGEYGRGNNVVVNELINGKMQMTTQSCP